MDIKETKREALPLALLAGGAALLFLRQLWRLTLSNYVVESDKLPGEFDGFRILQVSDLHNNKLLCHNGRLASKIKTLAPDIIVVTGDVVDSGWTDLDVAVRFIREAAAVCPVFYVPGNHEARLRERDILFRMLKHAGATLLFDRRECIEKGAGKLFITGVTDPHFDRLKAKGVSGSMRLTARLRSMPAVEEEFFNILLTHRSEHPALYSKYGYDLIFAGHAHGGQWRLPAFGAVYSPNQGLFPEYTAGVHRMDGAEMIISRGLGNSVLPLRINNPFELVMVTLKRRGRNAL